MDKEKRKKELNDIWFNKRHENFDVMFDEIISQEESMIKAEINNLKICKGCGHLSINKIEPPALACCPDNDYILVTESYKFMK